MFTIFITTASTATTAIGNNGNESSKHKEDENDHKSSNIAAALPPQLSKTRATITKILLKCILTSRKITSLRSISSATCLRMSSKNQLKCDIIKLTRKTRRPLAKRRNRGYRFSGRET